MSFYGLPIIQDAYMQEQTTVFYYGDGTSAPVIPFVNLVNSVQDWFLASVVMTHTYPVGTSSATAYVSDCCRINSLADGNFAQYFMVSTVIDFGTDINVYSSPQTLGIPIVAMFNNTLNRYIN